MARLANSPYFSLSERQRIPKTLYVEAAKECEIKNADRDNYLFSITCYHSLAIIQQDSLESISGPLDRLTYSVVHACVRLEPSEGRTSRL